MQFKEIYERAASRKGGEGALKALLRQPLSAAELSAIGDDRILSAMTRGVFQAGFTWRVIAQKWPGFEEAFFGFDVDKIAHEGEEHLGAWASDKRIVRNGQKIKTVPENARFVQDIAAEHGSFGAFLAGWDPANQVELFDLLKKKGSRLGGNTARWFLRYVGYDSFVLSSDVVATLNAFGADIQQDRNSKRDLQAAQAQFNAWHAETNLPYSILSQVAAYSCGVNYHADEGEQALAAGELPQKP